MCVFENHNNARHQEYNTVSDSPLSRQHKAFCLTLYRTGAAHGVHTSDKVIFSQHFPDVRRDARHNSHTQQDVVGVCQLNTDLTHGAAHWTHAERNHVHGSPCQSQVKTSQIR